MQASMNEFLPAQLGDTGRVDGSQATGHAAAGAPDGGADDPIGGPPLVSLSARDMTINVDNSTNIVEQQFNIDAINRIQFEANVHVERIRVEAVQALGNAENIVRELNERADREQRVLAAAAAPPAAPAWKWKR